jgi:hypothetical protein
MKRLVISLLVGVAFAFVWRALHEKPITDPVEYCNRLIAKHNEVNKMWAAFMSDVQEPGSGLTKHDLQKLINRIGSACQFARKTPDFEGEGSLRYAVVEALEFYHKTSDWEFRLLVPADGRPADGISQDADSRAQRTLSALAHDSKLHVDRVNRALNEFALQHDVAVEEDEAADPLP